MAGVFSLVSLLPNTAGADALGADQAQPIGALLVGKAHGPEAVVHALAPIFGSVPAKSRSMLAECLIHRIAVKSTNRSAACVP